MAAVILAVIAIVLPAAILTAALRRWITPVPWSVTAGLLALVFLFLGAGLVSPAHVPVPVDEVVRGYPYKGIVGPVQPRNPLTNDTVKQMLPWMDEARRQLFRGELPVWNPYAFSGYPLLGNGQSAPFSPFFLATLFVPLPKQLVAMAGLKIFVALLFTFLVARREGATTEGALLAAVIFAFSVFQTVYLYYPLTAVTALLPAAVFAIQRCADAPGFRSVALTAIIGACVLAGGHPESALHVALAAAMVLVLNVRGLRTALLGAVLGVALSAVAWLPVAEQALHSTRLQEVRTAGRHMTPAFPAAVAKVLLNPNVFGHPARGDWSGFGNYSMVAPNFVGLVALLLFVVALVTSRSPRTWYLGGLAILSFLVAMNWTFVGRAVNALPGFSSTANDRLRVITVFFVALVAARALPSRWTTLGRVALVACCLELFVLNVPFNALAGIRYYKPDLPVIRRLQAAIGERPGRVVGFDWTLLPNASVHYEVEDVRGSDPMALAEYVEFFRLVEAADPFSDVKRIQNVQQPGLDFLGVRYLLAEPGQNFGPPWQLLYQGADGNLFENPTALPRFFAPGIAEPLDKPRPLLDQLRGIADFRQRVLAFGIPYPLPNAPGALQHLTIEQKRSTAYDIDIETREPTFIASSVVAAPGWRITRDGHSLPIHTVNGAFLGCVVPAGSSRLHVRYQPATIRWGVAVTLMAALALAALRYTSRQP